MEKTEWWRLERIGFTLGEGSRPSERSDAALGQAFIAGVGLLAISVAFFLYDHTHGQKSGVYWPVTSLVLFSFTGRGYNLLGGDPKQTLSKTAEPAILRRRLRYRRDAGTIQFVFAFAISFLDTEMGRFLTGAVALLFLVFLYRIA